ncbi:hypothetical protein DFA_03668 [Cavenderia fasciculata]|uniref:AIG1-type G domain-containing protein n=1 Tax=Cavenderia fasciculata TaxID=261658 RepID=F4PIJ0_CACFS|nr:uncharacterized protein DFA_03668 [Cavenderia fasciculata]EGG25419.1 hypothetical protein DFA_03668 [Cavenderia fasciculata]|eukprot:XP_004363270.1 hypothetical protein DFA_03668 [Cavenderia fasciculata]
MDQPKRTILFVVSHSNEFHEMNSSTGCTQKPKKKIFKAIKGFKRPLELSVVDTVGLADPQQENEKIFRNIGETCHSLRTTGINQIIFVTKDRFDTCELACFQLVIKTLFAGDGDDKEELDKCLKHTTIIRTGTTFFKDEAKCKKDLEGLKNSDPFMKEMIEKCNAFIYVNNPPDNAATREESRTKILNHLIDNCSNCFFPSQLKQLAGELKPSMSLKKTILTKLKLAKKEPNSEVKTKELEKELEKVEKKSNNILKKIMELKNPGMFEFTGNLFTQALRHFVARANLAKTMNGSTQLDNKPANPPTLAIAPTTTTTTTTTTTPAAASVIIATAPPPKKEEEKEEKEVKQLKKIVKKVEVAPAVQEEESDQDSSEQEEEEEEEKVPEKKIVKKIIKKKIVAAAPLEDISDTQSVDSDLSGSTSSTTTPTKKKTIIVKKKKSTTPTTAVENSGSDDSSIGSAGGESPVILRRKEAADPDEAEAKPKRIVKKKVLKKVVKNVSVSNLNESLENCQVTE